MKPHSATESQKPRKSAERDRDELRARDAVAKLFARHLIVPTVFFDAQWPDEKSVDLVAIDRGGSGDVQVVEIKNGSRSEPIKTALRQLVKSRANYLWIAMIQDKGRRMARIPVESLYPPEGMGKVGVIRIERDKNGEFAARIETSAQRFAGSYYDLADRFRSTHKPDIEFR